MKKYQSILGEKPMVKDQSLLRHEDIRKNITVLPELEELIPPLQEDEFAQLEENIIREGCREALLIWETTQKNIDPDSDDNRPVYILIDGHNRYRICTKHDINFKIHLVNFESLPDVREYMIDNQLGRRNLNPEQISYLRGKKYNSQKLARGKYNREDHKGQNVPFATGSTSARIAEEFKVNEKTIKRDAEFALGLDKLENQLRVKILSGKIKVNKMDLQKLGKMEEAPLAISSMEEFSAAVGKTSNIPSPNPEKPVSNPKKELVAKLELLVKEVNIGTKPLSFLCDEIIKYAQDLKEFGKNQNVLKQP